MNNITVANAKCNRWLGPHQPGITVPDLTEIPGEQGEPSAGAAASTTADTTARDATRGARRARSTAQRTRAAPEP